MKNRLIFLPILMILACAGLLLGVSGVLSGLAEDNARTELINKMQTILPGSTEFAEETYTGDDANIRTVWAGDTGFVIETVTSGYAGDITMLVGISKAGRVMGLQVRDMEETWGLGGRALTDQEFLVQFLNTSGETEVGENVDALTGATVTSRAVTRGINSAVAYVTGADTSSGATSWGG